MNGSTSALVAMALLALFAVLLVLATAAVIYGSRRREQGTREIRLRLESARVRPSPTRYDARKLKALPAPVQRFFSMAGTPEIARGKLLRFFAEMAWYRTALLPCQGVRWEAVDDTSARATLTDGVLAVTLLFRFKADSLIGTVRAESRDRVIDGKNVGTPWQGRFWNYAERGGMQVPLNGEVAWMLPEGAKTYWRGTTTSLQYEFAK